MNDAETAIQQRSLKHQSAVAFFRQAFRTHHADPLGCGKMRKLFYAAIKIFFRRDYLAA